MLQSKRCIIAYVLATVGALPSHGDAQNSRTAIPTRVARVTTLPLSEDVGAPGLFTGSPDGLAFVDFANQTVYRGDAAGKWSAGWRKVGSGPGEIRTAGGMQFASNRTLWISDRGNSRITGRSDKMDVVFETVLSKAVGRIAPTRNGFLAIPNGASLITLFATDGKEVKNIPLPPDVAAQSPMTHERYLVRINDTLAVIQFRWMNRKLAISSDGRILYDSSTAGPPLPRILERKFNGGTAIYVDPKERNFATTAATRGDTVLVLLGNTDDTRDGREILRFNGLTGKTIDRLTLPVAITEIAATRAGVYAIGATDDGFVMYRITW